MNEYLYIRGAIPTPLLLLLTGLHPKVVSERLGHSSIVITLDTYSHVIPSLRRESSDKLDTVLFGQGSIPSWHSTN